MKRTWAMILVLGALMLGPTADAQDNPTVRSASPGGAMPMHHPMGGQMGNMMTHHGVQQAVVPTQPGQAAFGAIQEIVLLLQADPATDWSKVDIDTLRQHLIDMDEVTIRAAVRKETVPGGLVIDVTGAGRTLEAIRRMVPDHAREINGTNGWTMATASLPDGVRLTVTAHSETETRKIRALGFMGVMVQGGHHQPHHLAMARGEAIHGH